MNTSTKIQASVLILAIFGLAHYILSSIPLRFDLTEDNLYTLSDSTKSLLEKVEDPVDLQLYATQSIADLPAWFTTFGTRVEQLLKQYERASGGKVRLTVIEPKPDTPEEEAAVAAGLHGQELPSGEKVFLGLVATQGETEKTIPFFNWQKEQFLEYDVSRLVHEVQQVTKRRLGLITSLPLQAPPFAMPGQPQQEEQYIVEQLKTNFQIETIEPTAEKLPAGLDMLAIIHPQNLGEALLYAIDQYALSGKPIFVAVDPSSFFTRQQQNPQMAMMGGQADGSSDLPGLIDAWGLVYSPQNVVVDPNIGLAQGNVFEPAILVFDEANTNRGLLPTSDLNPVLMLEAGGFARKEGATSQWEPVLTTSGEAALVSTMFLQFSQGRALLEQAKPTGETYAVAGLLTGEIASAYPEGKPSGDVEGEEVEEDEELEAEEEEQGAEHRASGEATIFLIADSDWLLDAFSIQRINFLGMRAVQPQNDNQVLAANFFDYLGGSRDLIGIRGKGDVDRTFEVVKEMEAEAQKAYRAKLDDVEARLNEITTQITELASQQQGGGYIVATPEIEQALQKHREEEAALKSERRKVRRELRQGIESLGTTLKAINLLWAPIALLAFAILFQRARKGA